MILKHWIALVTTQSGRAEVCHPKDVVLWTRDMSLAIEEALWNNTWVVLYATTGNPDNAERLAAQSIAEQTFAATSHKKHSVEVVERSGLVTPTEFEAAPADVFAKELRAWSWLPDGRMSLITADGHAIALVNS